MKPIELINLLIEKENLKSNGQIGRRIGITNEAVRKIKMQNRMDDSTIVEVCKILQIDPKKHIAESHANKAKTENERKFWNDLAMIGAVATAAALPLLKIAQAGAIPVLCILC